MAITDLQISDTLETSAPSIRYEGNEGPKSPEEQQQMMLAELQQEYEQYRMEQIEIDPSKVLSFEEWYQSVYEASRQGVAHGGIMGGDGRERYGLGSIFKSITKPFKKVLGSDVGKAALLYAGTDGLGNLLAPGAASWGLGGGKGLGWLGPKKVMANWFGQKARPGKWLDYSKYYSGPKGAGRYTGAPAKSGILSRLGLTQGAGSMMPTMLGGLTAASALPLAGVGMGEEIEKLPGADIASQGFDFDYGEMRKEIARAVQSGDKAVFDAVLDKYNLTEGNQVPFWDTLRTGSAEGGRIGLYAGGQSIPSDYTMEDALMTTTQDKLGGITDVMKQADLYRQGDIGQFYAAKGGRIGYKHGNLTGTLRRIMERLQAQREKKRLLEEERELRPTGLGAAQGGRIGYAGGGADTGYPPVTIAQNIPTPPQMPAPQVPHSPMPTPQLNQMAMARGMDPRMRGMDPRMRGMDPRMRGMNPMGGGMNPMGGGMNPMGGGMNPMGGRRMAQEGGLMDLGGMEKDYRQEGGFVPIGGKEKADDVPARLSKNEFVFTADAVRAAGGGDIDKGAGIMENVMNNLEQGGQISEESQGLGGAQEMFDVSERLSEVV